MLRLAALLAAFSVLGAAATARAGGDSDTQLGQAVPIDLGAGLSNKIGHRPADADGAASVFPSEREAAIAFVDMARKLPEQRFEYCAYILRNPNGRFGFGPVRRGDMNHCPADRPKPANAVSDVHTHPRPAGGDDVSAPEQVFSDSDYAFSESAEMHFPIYLGAPAGHVLRYVPGHTFCKGASYIMRQFEVVRDLRPTVIGRLPVNPGQYLQLYDIGGQKLPKPSYCKDAPR